MRLLICTQKLDKNDSILGFTHRWVLEFAKVYDEVTVICLYKGVVELPQNVRVLSLGKEAGESRVKYLRNFFSYIFNERAHYDHVFVHMNQVYVLLGGMFWRLWGKRVGFWYAHGHVPFTARVAALFSHKLFTSTKHGFPIAMGNREIVGQGIDLGQFHCPERQDLSPERQDLSVVTVGRLSTIKNYEVVIDAVGVLRLRGLKAALTLIGGAETEDQRAYEAKLRTLAREKGLSEQVKFLGAVPNHELREHLCRADIFVNTGLTGSLDKTGLEAIASGLPVLACNPAYEVVFKEDKARFMFSKDNAVELADALEREVHAKDRKTVIAKLKEHVAREHGLERLVEKIQAGLTKEERIS